MNDRKILCLQPAEITHSTIHKIRSAGWDAVVAPNVDAARGLIATREFRVGVALLDGHEEAVCTKFIDRARELFSYETHMEWVGLLAPCQMQVSEIRRVIGACFYDYLTWPVEMERLHLTLGHAYGMAELTTELWRESKGALQDCRMIGSAPAMQRLLHQIRKVALDDAPVLITGESGTGKELAARAVHANSPCAEAPFVAVNCGALPTHLVQSELFGHEKGAFTGAHRSRCGRIERASGGTFFLDEVGDLPLELQANLLRFLQEGTVERVGGTAPINIDVRVIAATNVNLEDAVREGRFREDLYYRLNVLRLETPALRERTDDIEPLACFFLETFCKDKHRKMRLFDPPALEAMRAYAWPGNVRELINRVRRAVVMCENRVITAADLGLQGQLPERPAMTLDETRVAAEIEAIKHTLRRTGFNVSQAARLLGVSRRTLYRLMEKYGIDPVRYRQSACTQNAWAM